MRVIAILMVWVMLAVAARAQAPEAKPGSVAGIVVNSVTTEPVKKAVVTLQCMSCSHAGSNGTTTASTDTAGHFRFDHIEPGSYFVVADRDGFQAFSRRGAPEKLTVSEGQQVEDVAVKLLPLGTVEGHVLDEDGDPLIRATVRAMRYQYDQHGRRLVTGGATSTDDHGAFQIADLSPGRYYFAASVTGPELNLPPRTRWTRPEEAYPTTFYPNATEAGQAMATDLAAGAKLNNIDFRLQKAPAYHLRGKVVGISQGAGRVFLQLSGTSGDGRGFPVALEKDGSFDRGGIVSGSYSVAIWQQGGDSRFSGRQQVNVADQDVNGIVLTPSASLNIPGTVTVEGTAPDKLMVHVALNPVEAIIFFRGPTFQMGNDGSFTIEGLLQEAYRVQVFNVPQGKYVKSIRFGNREVKDGQIDLSAGVVAPLNIVLGADGASLGGTVETSDGQPAVGALVTIVPEGDQAGREDLFKQTVTEADGKFAVKDIAPGEYRIFAWEDTAEDPVRSPEFQAAFESRSAAVVLDPNGHESVMLTLISSDEVEKQRSKLP